MLQLLYTAQKAKYMLRKLGVLESLILGWNSGILVKKNLKKSWKLIIHLVIFVLKLPITFLTDSPLLKHFITVKEVCS